MLTNVVVGGALLYFPGAAALVMARSTYRGLTHLSASLGLSIGIIPLLLLWSGLVGAVWNTLVVWIALAGSAAIVAWNRFDRRAGDSHGRSKHSLASNERLKHSLASDTSNLRSVSYFAREALRFLDEHAAEVATLIIVGLAIVLRLLDGMALAVPAWVDGYHHTMITEKIVSEGGVPSDLRPWLAVDRFYYHFGFHSVAAAFVLLCGMASSEAVLILGQALCALVALPTWWLARRMTDSPWSAVFASAVPATLYWFPAYFVAWGRYTQLAGLVILPVALILLWDAIIEQPSWSAAVPRITLAAIAAAGLVLVHYRVAVFFAIGAVVVLIGALIDVRQQRATLARWSAVATMGGVLVAPWFAVQLFGGVRAMESVTANWYTWDPTSNSVPEWLFTIGDNRVWISVGAIGLIAGLLAGRKGAFGAALVLALAGLAVNPALIGLPSSWMLPSFALAISLFSPIAIGVGFGVSEALRAIGFQGSSGDRRLAIAVLVVALVGALRMHVVVAEGRPSFRTMDNRARTEIFSFADQAGMDWVRNNTPSDARFLVSTAHWQLGSYRGLDGGYWLPLLTGRQSSAPAALYTYGAEADVLEVQAICERASRADGLSDDELIALMEDGAFDHVYVGPAAARHGGFSAERLRRHSRLEEIFAADGVYIFRIAP